MDWRRWLRKPPVSVGESPYFGHPFCVNWFEEQLKACDQYVEYGSGGSTVLAAKMGVPTVSIESDESFLDMVKTRLSEMGLLEETRNRYLYRDIGPVGPWGRPLRADDPALFSRFRGYSDFPLQDLDLGVFLVLVDGRFRVASALKSLRSLSGKHGSVVVDDYLDRPEYHVVERFAPLAAMVGRIAVFSIPAPDDLERDALDRAISDHELDFR